MSLQALPSRVACRFPPLLALALKRRRTASRLPHLHYGYWQPGPGGPSRKIERLAERFPPTPRGFNLLYTVNGNFCPVGLAKAASLAGIPILYNANGLYYRAWFGDGWEAQNDCLRQIYQRSSYVFYQSEYSRTCARAWQVGHWISRTLKNSLAGFRRLILKKVCGGQLSGIHRLHPPPLETIVS